MVFTSLGAGWFIKTLAILFVWALDSIAYLLVSVSYTLFLAVSQLNLFATSGGASIYSEISSRIYTVLSIVMVFVFAYYLLMMIVEPEGNNNKASSALIKETIISIIVIVLLPVFFNYMSLFQTHVLQENTIGSIILGANGATAENPGKQISMIVFSAFYHPKGSGYATFIDNEGKMISSAVTDCEANGASNKVCQEYYDGLEGWLSNSDSSSVYSLTSRSKLRNSIGDDGGMDYTFVVCTGCAVLVAYFFISYAIDLGTRAVKLGVLQLIAPIPIILRIFPKSKKNFDSWFSEIKKTYLDVFVRVAIVFFVVLLCSHVNVFIDTIFSSNDNLDGGFTVRAFATVCLILGLLKFAKEAPDMFKAIFAGDLFKGLDFKPGVKRRVQENEYAMKGMSTIVGSVGGAIGTGFMRYNKSIEHQRDLQRTLDANGDPLRESNPSRLRAFGAAVTSMPRGLIVGGKKGFDSTPKDLSFNNIKKSGDVGVSSAQASLIHAENVYQNFGEKVGEFRNDPSEWAKKRVDTAKSDFKDKRDEIKDYLTGKHAGGDAAIETLNKATENITKYFDLTSKSVEQFDKVIDDFYKKILKGEKITYNGVDYSMNGDTANPNNPQHRRWEELKAEINKRKNQEIAKDMMDKFKEGGAANMATLRDLMKKDMSKLGIESISNLNKKVADSNVYRDPVNKLGKINDVSQFLEKLSDTKAVITQDDIELLSGIKSALSNQQKNIVVTQQAKPKEESKK